jgi:hypothetical protein
VIEEGDERPPDAAEEPFELLDTDDDAGSPARPGSLLGAIGQIAAAVLIVVALVALFIGAAIAFRLVFG